MTYDNYTIILQIIDNRTEQIVGKRESSDSEIIEQTIADIPKWIKRHERIEELIAD